MFDATEFRDNAETSALMQMDIVAPNTDGHGGVEGENHVSQQLELSSGLLMF